MLVDTQVVSNMYRDSVSLMRISSNLCDLSGVSQAYCLMATETNLDLLRDTRLLGRSLNAGANDILIVVEARDRESLDQALVAAKEALEAKRGQSESGTEKDIMPSSIVTAIGEEARSNLALISTPGPYAASEALKALAHGLNVMIFSDNVSLADEVLLKERAENSDLLVMGPDCGTAIIDGIPLGFANNVCRGPIGLVGASGTGLQQVACLVHRFGAGVSQVIGVGSRDLSLEVSGLSTIRVLKWFERDQDTKVVVIISKPADKKISAWIFRECKTLRKPVVICLLGEEPDQNEADGVYIVSTLEEAAKKATEVAGYSINESNCGPREAGELITKSDKRKYLRGLYCGGTFCLEAFQILQKKLNPLSTNVALETNPLL